MITLGFASCASWYTLKIWATANGTVTLSPIHFSLVYVLSQAFHDAMQCQGHTEASQHPGSCIGRWQHRYTSVQCTLNRDSKSTYYIPYCLPNKKIHNISPQITINTMPGQAIAIICDSRVSQAYLQPISVQISLLFNMQLTCVNLTAGSLIFLNYSIAPNGPRESCVFINKKILGSEYWM